MYTFRLNVKQAFTAKAPTMDEWHAALGHPQRRIVSSLIKQFHLPCSSNSSCLCSSCILGKHARLSLRSVQHKSTAPFQLIYSDFWGLAPLLSSLGHCYALIFIDDYSRYTWVYLIKNKK